MEATVLEHVLFYGITGTLLLNISIIIFVAIKDYSKSNKQ